MRLTRCTVFLAPATAFILLGLVASARWRGAVCTAGRWAGLGIAGAFVTPILVSSNKPILGALPLSRHRHRSAFGLARSAWALARGHTIAFALLWTFPCLQCGPSMIGPHAFHVTAGLILAAAGGVGFMFGPRPKRARSNRSSSGSLAAYLFGASLIVLNSAHADSAWAVFAALVAAPCSLLARARRCRRYRRRIAIRVRGYSPNGRLRGNRTCGACRSDRCPESARLLPTVP